MGRCLALLALLLTGCGPASPPSPAPPPATDGPAVYAPQAGIAGEVTVAFALPAAPEEPAAGGFVRAMPWPSELWRRPDGRLDFRDFPGADSFLVGRAVAESEAEVTAFAVNPVVFFHLSGAIDPSRLPPPAADPSPTGRVALLDVDPESPERGRAVPLEHRWYGEAQRFVPANTLAIKPLAGFVLRPATLYAAVVHRDLGAPPLGTSRDLELTKWTQPHPEPAAERARRLHGPALDLLTQEGVPRSAVAALAVFRTGRPTAVTEAMIAVSARLGPPRQPRLLRAEWLAGHTPPDRGFRVIRGYYCTPSFQREIDAVPFVERGGTVVLDRDGQPQLQPIPTTSPFRTDECGDLLRARFVLTVPTTPMPAAGWPLLVTAHGTTGSALSLTDVDNFAGWAAREGIAAVSTDQPLHGGDDPVSARPGSRKPFKLKFGGIPIRIPHEGQGSELAFYNALRPAVMRDNLRQAAVDGAVLARLMLATDFTTAKRADGSPLLPPGSAEGPAAPRFDPDKLLLAGHSQGSQSTIVHGALNPQVRGVLLSGCGGDVRLAFTRRRDTNALAIARLLLNLAEDELDEFHPLLALVQTTIDPADPLSYARRYWQRPKGAAPVSLLTFEGIGDTMTVVETAEALAVALRARPLRPVVREVPGLLRLGITPAATVQGNAAAGRATIALVQLAPTQGEDGHFVMHYEPAGALLVRQFLGALSRGQVPPTVGPLPAATP